jgi:hypothetical protein
MMIPCFIGRGGFDGVSSQIPLDCEYGYAGH